MKHLWILLMLIPLATTACKDGVTFGTTQNSELDVTNSEQNGPQGPVVKIMQAPSDHKLNKSTQVVFEVIKGDNEIANVECLVDSHPVNCDWVRGVFDLEGEALGLHLFQVIATDVEGLVGDAEEDWAVFNNFVRNTDEVNVTSESKKTDILFVIDNSSSMQYEQTQISVRFANFIDEIVDVDWHLGITTTDPRSSETWSDGRLDPFKNGDYFLTPALGKDKAQKLFAEHVRRRESGWDTENGINATYRAIERSLTGREKVDQELRKFFRPEAALAVVVVSDEDESNNGKKNDGNNLIKLVRDNWGTDKVFQFNSIIVHTQKCLDGAGSTWGHKYEQLSQKTNGMVGDICAKNYSQMLTDLGKGVANLKRVQKLKCVPQDIDEDGKVDLLIKGKGHQNLPGYTVDKDVITFDQALSSGDYVFEYFCLEE